MSPVVSELEVQLIDEAWDVLTADDPGLRSPHPARVEVRGTKGHLQSRWAVEQTAVACVATALAAAAALHRQRGGSVARVRLERGHVAAAVRSERYFRQNGRPAGSGFAALSRFWPTADGWVRTHANYSWHRAALLEALGAGEAEEAVAAAIAERSSEEIEQRVFDAGGIAAAVRSVDAWRSHPQGQALAAEPLIGHDIAGDARPRRRPAGDLPASGIRVLDLTRVIAGPVCTRFLAALGAMVVRLDPPQWPDMAPTRVADSLLGKRSAFVDLGGADGAATLERLLGDADVVVCGYRPGALERFGFKFDALADRHPGLVVASLDAWGHCGPWSARRGFDSVVQAPTGIAEGESRPGGGPGALPCQLLDHGTGYLAAAAVLDGLRRQQTAGATHVRRLSLARTAMWLTTATPDAPATPGTTAPTDVPTDSPWLVDLDSAQGPVRAVAPPGTLDDRRLQWPHPLTGYGNDPPTWPRDR